MITFFQSVTAWLAANPAFAGGVVFLLAASESIVVIGAFVPGTAVLLALSAAVGLGQLPLWPILIGAIAGAIAGDGLSYWLGHRYRDGIVRFWPLSRVYLAAHWPSDVLGGLLFGAGIAAHFDMVFRRMDLRPSDPAGFC